MGSTSNSEKAELFSMVELYVYFLIPTVSIQYSFNFGSFSLLLLQRVGLFSRVELKILCCVS